LNFWLRAVSSLLLCRGKSLQTVSELLKVAASTTITNKLALTPLTEALVSGRTENAQLLMEKVCLIGHAKTNLPAVANYVHEFLFCGGSFWEEWACRGKGCTLGNTPGSFRSVLLHESFRLGHVEKHPNQFEATSGLYCVWSAAVLIVQPGASLCAMSALSNAKLISVSLPMTHW